MDQAQRDKRREIMARSRALGHCVCDPQKPCPCDDLKLRDLCPCAGERPAPQAGPVRLTEHVHKAGCASKINKNDLQRILAGLPELDDPRVVLGRQAGDDAGVIMLDDERGTVLTVDVFTPPVDDPELFGRIAAANSISDIYAMGAHPEVALSIVGFPIQRLPGEAMQAMLRGGIEALGEVGVSVIGGHSLDDEEVKLGFAVIGSCEAGKWLGHAGARIGDALVLTKPIGGGLLGFAHQIGRAPVAAMTALTEAMCRFNRCDGEQLWACDAHACTDVTGFSLLGHLAEMCRKSGLRAELDFDAIPLFPAVRELARQDVVPGGVERNRESVPEDMLDLSSLQPAQRAALFSPETSGGLLVALAPDDAERYCEALNVAGIECSCIGRMTAAHEGGFIAVDTRCADDWSPQPLSAVEEQNEIGPSGSCCAAAGTSDCCQEQDDSGCQSAASGCCEQAAAGCCEAAAEPAIDDGQEPATALPNPAAAGAFATYMRAINAPGAIDEQHKKLMALALSVSHRCEECIVVNLEAARAAGASDAAIGEAVDLGVAFGGAPAMMCYRQVQKR